MVHSQERERGERPRCRITNKPDGMEVGPSGKNEQDWGSLGFSAPWEYRQQGGEGWGH